MRALVLVAAIALVAAAPVQASFVGIDTTANDTAATAESLGSSNPDFAAAMAGNGIAADVGIASLAASGSDVDFYKVTVPDGYTLTAITTPLGVFPSDPDTIIGLFDMGGTLIVDNDDAGDDENDTGTAGSTRGSAARYQNLSGGAQMILIGVTGFDDFDFDGFSDFTPTVGHGQTGAYALTVSLVPEPATWAALAAGVFCLIRRRR